MTVAVSKEPAPLQQPKYSRPRRTLALGVGVRVFFVDEELVNQMR